MVVKTSHQDRTLVFCVLVGCILMFYGWARKRTRMMKNLEVLYVETHFFFYSEPVVIVEGDASLILAIEGLGANLVWTMMNVVKNVWMNAVMSNVWMNVEKKMNAL